MKKIVASFSCFADLELFSLVPLSKVTEKLAFLNEFSSRVRQFFTRCLTRDEFQVCKTRKRSYVITATSGAAV